MPRLQVHVAGAKRAGKTTLARKLMPFLEERGLHPVLLEVDEIKFKMFGSIDALPDTPESLRLHGLALEIMFNIEVPIVLASGCIPLVVATHSSPQDFERAKHLSEKTGSSLRFIVLEPPTLEEAAIRAAAAQTDDRSDMRDFAAPTIRESFLRSVEKIEATYRGLADPRVRWIAQSGPETMAREALNFILAE
ncbi:hypothetical protein A3A39_02465 [Candidatus Kaiserbacteria bacterium RIFCSPLOWO2_01_FULL_54_13]|uniref:Shikimate kinase n=1 Tax=Candidatus Kaiserbacteria bacterium RIFCSPLOWO2_01_FULL_54_13 TaxID=1798512 RepID=A0A1F6F154_9BACT|nr:MAG: hypothetical protein A3A39_02465 [Candidatus Kaiserbacteria bacterium RIFCSPLOWO2_01_FULL_54_13]